MKILKFGGTSVGNAQRIKDVAKLICDGTPKIVVLSAMSGTTNSLVEISDYLYKKNEEGATELISRLLTKYLRTIDELYSTEAYKLQAKEAINVNFNHIRSFVKEVFTPFEEREILSKGELLSSYMVHYYLLETGIKSALIPALDYMRVNETGEPDSAFIKDKLLNLLKENEGADMYITQGYICRNAKGEVDNLGRGGSDYTASLVGAAVRASEIQIWTDIDGMHNNDPRIVKNTSPVRKLNFSEAAELAYFGAKILHPTCIQPAKLNNIPVRLLNTMQPDAPGTTISHETEKAKIKAVAAKDNITAIKIKSGRMLLVAGFLRKVFEVFEKHRTPIDLVTTSEVGVSVTIDNDSHLDSIVNELKKFGAVTVDRNMMIVCVVGDIKWENVGFESKIIDAVKDIPVRMISYGGSNYNVSLLIRASDKEKALQSLSDHLFNNK
ncbi:MAG: aspartate kinase [Tannerella sp.]|jgi:aspartate kinase|nr:aspartate kinase [Tannerella sp.]